MIVACSPSGVKVGSVALNISYGVLTTHRQEWEFGTRMMTNPIGPLADLLGIRGRAGQRLATERDRAWRKPDAAHTNHAVSAHRAPVRVVVVGGPQVPAHRARSRIASARATVSVWESFTPGAPRP
jgi:hypothetical protein